MRLGKWYKFPVLRYISSKDLMYSIVTIVNNTILKHLKALREQSYKVSPHKHTHRVAIGGDGCVN